MSNPNQAKRRSKALTHSRLTAILCILLTASIMITLVGCKSRVDAERATEAPTTEAETQAPTEPPFDVLHFETPKIPDDGTTEGGYSSVDPGVYLYNGSALELCGASDSAAEDYAGAISEFKKSVPDLTVYNIVVPTHTEFALPQRVIDGGVYSASQSQNIKTVYSSYTEDVKPINIYNALCDHIGEYLYFNTDHHWTGLGAYYAYTAFCEQTDQEALKLSDCEEHTIEGFEGSFYSTGDLTADTVHYWTFPYETHAMITPEMGNDPYETSVYMEGIEAGPNCYLTFIGGDSANFIAYNDTKTDNKKIMVVKESYGNAFIPYLTYNYKEVHVVDSRYFTGSLKSYMQENGISEILFINNTMSSNNPFMVDGIRGIF